MKAYKYIISLAALLLTVASCSEDTMDRINKNEGNPEAKITDARFSLTDGIVASVFTANCGNLAWYVSSYTEQLFGTGNNQLRRAELRDPIETAGSTTFNNEWNGIYLNLKNLQAATDKCQPGGINEGDKDLLPMCQVLSAYNWGILTDLFGDIPCTEALSSMQPKVDKQKDVYDRIFSLLDSAIVNGQIALDEGATGVGSQDLLFKGDVNQWIGLAHALKARYKLHLYGRDNSVLQTVIDEANTAIDYGFNGAELKIFDGVAQYNPWFAYMDSRYYTGSSSTVANLMQERNDPREAAYNFDFMGANTLADPGNAELAGLTYVVNAPLWLANSAAPAHLFSKAELYFILAEAKQRLGEEFMTDFETAVRASMADFDTAENLTSEMKDYMWGADPGYVSPFEIPGQNGAGEMISILDEVATDYLNRINDRLQQDPLAEIMVQKYLAQSRDEQLETYNDIRRCMYVDKKYYVTLTNPKNKNGAGANRWPLSLPYGNSDVLSNPNVKALFGSGNDAGTYIFTKNVWWAGGE